MVDKDIAKIVSFNAKGDVNKALSVAASVGCFSNPSTNSRLHKYKPDKSKYLVNIVTDQSNPQESIEESQLYEEQQEFAEEDPIKPTSTSTKKTKTNVSIKALTIDSLDRSIDSEAEAEVSEDVSFVEEDVFVVLFQVVFSHAFDVEDVVIERMYVQLQSTLILSKVIVQIHVHLADHRLINQAIVPIRIFRLQVSSHQVIQPFEILKLNQVRIYRDQLLRLQILRTTVNLIEICPS